MFDMLSFIELKRDEGEATSGEVRSFVKEFASERIPDYQAASWLMAVCFNGLSEAELREFTLALADSGSRMTFGKDLFLVDKHSTGGVGDKITLILVPLAAACGLSVAKLSGPGLGFTGGTVDKLAALPGFRTHLTSGEFRDQVRRIGCAVSGHSEDLAPAEGKFYSLRDVTGTVPSLPLICSSIVSKKIAGGADAFVFDVKCGKGAFMKTRPEGKALAEALVSLSRSLGKKSSALVTAMDQPLGEWIGNAAEVIEAVDVLQGRGPADVRELSVKLAGRMLVLAGKGTAEEGERIAEDTLSGGGALEKFREFLQAQGGPAEAAEDPRAVLPLAGEIMLLRAEKDGTVESVDARAIGEGVKRLGGGRQSLHEVLDLSVAVRLCRKEGEGVRRGDPLLEIRYSSGEKLREALPWFTRAFVLAEKYEKKSTAERSIVLETIE